jgi:hypothetical protein
VAIGTYFVFMAIYAGTMSDRLLSPDIYNHYIYLADSFLHGRLEMVRPPPHQNDWAFHEGRWYVSFPPVPAVLMVPGVAIWGWDPDAPSPVPRGWQRPGTERGCYTFNQGPFNLLFAPLPPLLLLVLLERLRRAGRSRRTRWENLTLVALYGLGTVYYCAAVQADTWHIAHVIGCTFLGLYMLASLEGRHPVLAGLCLGLAFGSRTPMIFAFPFFVYEAARANAVWEHRDWGSRIRAMLSPRVVGALVLFGLASGALVGAWLMANQARFGDFMDFGHRHLQVRWLPRIEDWGLFDLHFLPRNLAAALVLLPWATSAPPYFEIGHHGLAIWFTTPVLLCLLWPRKLAVEEMQRPPLARRFWPEWLADLHWPMWICVLAVALPSLLYQNTGWVQFGYRFSNDYMLFFMVLLAVGNRPMNRVFRTLVVLSIVVSLFGAVTFNRVPMFYNQDLSQQVFFQPD